MNVDDQTLTSRVYPKGKGKDESKLMNLAPFQRLSWLERVRVNFLLSLCLDRTVTLPFQSHFDLIVTPSQCLCSTPTNALILLFLLFLYNYKAKLVLLSNLYPNPVLILPRDKQAVLVDSLLETCFKYHSKSSYKLAVNDKSYLFSVHQSNPNIKPVDTFILPCFNFAKTES